MFTDPGSFSPALLGAGIVLLLLALAGGGRALLRRTVFALAGITALALSLAGVSPFAERKGQGDGSGKVEAARQEEETTLVSVPEAEEIPDIAASESAHAESVELFAAYDAAADAYSVQFIRLYEDIGRYRDVTDAENLSASWAALQRAAEKALRDTGPLSKAYEGADPALRAFIENDREQIREFITLAMLYSAFWRGFGDTAALSPAEKEMLFADYAVSSRLTELDKRLKAFQKKGRESGKAWLALEERYAPRFQKK